MDTLLVCTLRHDLDNTHYPKWLVPSLFIRDSMSNNSPNPSLFEREARVLASLCEYLRLDVCFWERAADKRPSSGPDSGSVTSQVRMVVDRRQSKRTKHGMETGVQQSELRDASCHQFLTTLTGEYRSNMALLLIVLSLSVAQAEEQTSLLISCLLCTVPSGTVSHYSCHH